MEFYWNFPSCTVLKNSIIGSLNIGSLLTRLLYQKSPLLRTGIGNCLQKGCELVMSIIEIMDFKSATYVLDARCKRINDYMLISRAIISSSIFAISENPKSDG